MTQKKCPFLGLEDDPVTYFALPTAGNFCHKSKKKVAVAVPYQQEYCLTERHAECSVFNSLEPINLPPESIVKAKPIVPNGVRVPFQWVILAVFGAMFLLLIAGLILREAGSENLTVVSNSPDDLAFYATIPGTNYPTPTHISMETSVFSSNNGWLQCTPPANWGTYVFNPTDSLIRLSILFNVSVEELKAANCLGDTDIIKPGELIYIPGPTATPSISVTPIATITRTRSPVQYVPWTPTSAPERPQPPQPTAKPVEPTAAPPPTAVPPTDVPPTVEPTPIKDPDV